MNVIWQRLCKSAPFFWVSILCMNILGCSFFKKEKSESPPGYDLNNPVVIKLPTELDEISGLAYYAEDTCVFANVDEAGLLYKIFLNHPKKIMKWKFAPASDYEDIILLDSAFYILSSEGRIVAFKFRSDDTLERHEYRLKLPGKNEFETMFYHPATKKITLMCKDCDMDDKAHLSGFTFDPRGFQFDTARFVIDVATLAALAGETDMKFKPSAAAIHPVTGELYIISSINKLLVVAEGNGEAKRTFRLSNRTFKQPEGITFTHDGSLIISNEAAGRGVANIMIFPFHPKVYKRK